MRTLLAILMLGVSISVAVAAQSATLDTEKIERVTGLKGTMNTEENVFKVSKARPDLKAKVDEWAIPPFMGLTSWAAFTPTGHGEAMMMGDTVLMEDEVNPVMSAALDAGLEVTALHNHFLYDNPKIYFMHISGMGDVDTLSSGVKRIYDRIGEIRAQNPQPQPTFGGPAIAATNTITPEPIQSILGAKGQAKDGMLKLVFGRSAKMHGTPIAKEMGVNTWAAFAGSDDAAVVDGDFAMTENELQTVLKAMRREGVNVVAIHQHMSQEEPRILFLHYWGTGDAKALAQSLRHVLDAQSHSVN